VALLEVQLAVADLLTHTLEVVGVVAQVRDDLHVVEEGDLVERGEGVVVERARQHDVLDEAHMEVLVDLAHRRRVGDRHDLVEFDLLLEECAVVD